MSSQDHLPPGVDPADLDLIRESGLFDPDWYGARHGDVALMGLDPAAHYLWLGGRLGRNPSARFDTRAYLAMNGDVAATGMNPLLHYLRFGRDEGRWVTPPVDPATARAPRRRGLPVVNWVMNPDNIGWAYGNNARALSARLPGFEHVIDGYGMFSDVALYFDIRVWQMRGRLAARNLLRVGGPRPLRLAYGTDRARLAADLAGFDAVIVLNGALFDELSPLHPSVHLVPNALDLGDWSPLPHPSDRRGDRPFTLGFAANLGTEAERVIKGYDLVEEAAQRLNLPLVHFGKGRDQIPREEMRERFFGAIDCLIHPVGPAKEGCSNTIMEALALGVPVITTRDAGFHAERIADGEGILYAAREVGSLTATIARLQGDPALADRMAAAGRRFAEDHHDIARTARIYARLLSPGGAAPPPVLHLVPFWEPPARFASSRLRCLHPAALLEGSALVRPVVEGRDLTDPPAGPVLVSQLATDATLTSLQAAPGTPVIYDLCDRYFDDGREIGGVNAKARFHEMAARATVLTASTPDLKRQITGLGLGKPVVFLPDGIDYRTARDARPTDPEGPVVWFGNPGRGNFSAARWMIDHLRQTRPVRLISARGYFLHEAKTDPVQAEYAEICTAWQEDSFIPDLRACSLCLIAHGTDETAKSPNRLVTAVMNGLPAVVASSPACAALLRAGGMGWAVVRDAGELEAAVARLRDATERARYLAAMQALIEADFGDAAIRNRYEALVTDHLPPVGQAARPIRLMVVSHNLSAGEGAPTSLMQVVTGLKATHPDIAPVVFAPLGGDLARAYTDAGIPVILPHDRPGEIPAALLIAQRQETMERAFLAALEEHRADAVLVNTATSLWFADLAEARGIPTLAMIRESSNEHLEFAFGHPRVMEGCRRGLAATRRVIFVAEETRRLWSARHDMGRTALIPNGIDLAPLTPWLEVDKAEVRAELGLNRNDIVLLSVGSINARKAQGDIVAALAALPRDLWAKLRLVLLGARPSDYLDALRAQVAALDPALAARIRIEPETETVGPWYAAADVFVFASLNESYPRVILEAMAFGLPIVSSAIFGTQEQIAEGRSGLLFPPGDVGALAGLLERVIRDGDLRGDLAQGAAARFWELPGHAEMVHRLSVQIRQVLDEAADRAEAG
ncbi:MAG: glycosyltransferase [Rubellimicrobium sp.]|nr:glycosyltransferase [Rubellimicrobium sp.]